MLFIAFLLIVAVGCWLWRIHARSPARPYGRRLVWRAACVIGLVRIGALWAGATLYQSSTWPQGPGYILQILALPEIYLVKGMRGHPLQWLICGSMLLAATSFLWAELLMWVVDRRNPRHIPN